MKKVLLLTIFTLGFPQHVEASKESELLKALVKCASENIRYLDDEISPADIIGAAALDACHDEEQAAYLFKVSGMSAAQREGFDQVYDVKKIFTSFVLVERAKRRKSKTSQ